MAHLRLVGFLLSTALLAGCGGSSSSSPAPDPDPMPDPGPPANVVGLTMPDTMSIVTPRETATSATGTLPAIARMIDDPGTDYATDVARTHVYDQAMEPLNVVNMILCLMEQTRASDMVNAGPYTALVNEDRCDEGDGGGDPREAGGSEFNSWTIDSTRASNDAPQIVHIWVPGENAGNPEDVMDTQTILVEVTVDDGVSETAPFGDFQMSFEGVIDGTLIGQSGEVATMRGMLRTVDNGTSPQFEFFNSGGSQVASGAFDFGFVEAANVTMADADGNAGSARTYKFDQYTPPGEATIDEMSSWGLAFDVANVARAIDADGDDAIDTEACLSRDEFDTNVWAYNLYHAEDGTFAGTEVMAGERVELSSGFPFTYDSNGDGIGDAHGWLGYHGAWTETDDIIDGTPITEYDYVNDVTRTHALAVSGGKLMRRTANTELLATFDGDQFQYWGQHPTLDMHGEWLVTLAGGQFAIVARFEWTDTGMQGYDTIDHDGDPETAEVPVAADLTFTDGENLWLYSDALGGNVVYVHDGTVDVADRVVTFYANATVGPGDDLFGDGPVTLYCYDRCLRGGLTQDDVDAAASEWDLQHPFEGTPIQYTLDASAGRLTLADADGTAVTVANLDLSELGYEHGLSTGDMVVTPLANPDEPWAVYDEPETFQWESGPNSWNAYVTAVMSDGTVARFDQPLTFVYTHTTANDIDDDAANDGRKYVLDYNGPRNLHGFPYVPDDTGRRWEPTVSLVDGVMLTNDDGTFAARGMELEQSMQEVDAAECDDLDVDAVFADAALELPTGADVGEVSFSLADRPDVMDAPAVIEGELQ